MTGDDDDRSYENDDFVPPDEMLARMSDEYRAWYETFLADMLKVKQGAQPNEPAPPSPPMPGVSPSEESE
jgi:hypothetical protein